MSAEHSTPSYHDILTMPRSPPVPKVKNGPCYHLHEDYPPSNYATLVPSRKRAKDHRHMNSILEGIRPEFLSRTNFGCLALGQSPMIPFSNRRPG